MGARKETLHCAKCQSELEQGYCYECREFEPEPLKESELYDNEEFILL